MYKLFFKPTFSIPEILLSLSPSFTLRFLQAANSFDLYERIEGPEYTKLIMDISFILFTGAFIKTSQIIYKLSQKTDKPLLLEPNDDIISFSPEGSSVK